MTYDTQAECVAVRLSQHRNSLAEATQVGCTDIYSPDWVIYFISTETALCDSLPLSMICEHKRHEAESTKHDLKAIPTAS